MGNKIPVLKNKYTYVGLALLLVSGYFVTQYFLNSNSGIEIETLQIQKDASEALIFSNNRFVQSQILSAEGRHAEALEELLGLENEYVDLPDNVILESAIAEETMKSGPQASGAKLFAKIYHNESYSSTTRAHAMLMVLLEYRGLRDAELFMNFYPEMPWALRPWQSEVELMVVKRILELHPFSIAESKIVMSEILSQQEKLWITAGTPPPKELSSFVSNIMDRFNESVRRDVLFQTQHREYNNLIPHTHITLGRMYSVIDVASIVLEVTPAKQRAEDAYANAVFSSRKLGLLEVEQLAILNYANHFALNENFVRAKEVIHELEKSTPRKLITDALKSPEAKRKLKGLDAMVRKDANITYFKQFGW